MIKRHLEGLCFDSPVGRQMRFISGPRQAGKTTLARHFLSLNHSERFFYNGDQRETRNATDPTLASSRAG
jgi:predicted AAA+ superfamily ATPase